MSVGDLMARDDDRPAFVRFERRAVKDSEATLKEGRYVSKDEDYALITPPYSKDIIEKKVDSWFDQVDQQVRSGRVPDKHFEFWKESYDRWQKGQEPPVDGTSVKNWSAISPAQCQNLINAGCRTIEDLAQANDEAMRRLGMGGQDLRNKAKAWVQSTKDHGPLVIEMANLKNENSQLKGTIDSLQKQIELMGIQLDAQSSEANPHKSFRATVEEIHESEEVAKSQVSTLLHEEYEKKFGRKPGHMKDETIRQKLNEG